MYVPMRSFPVFCIKEASAVGHAAVKAAYLTVSTCLSTVPSAKNCGFLVSTTIRSKKERQDSF